jgi:hypothetical protein
MFPFIIIEMRTLNKILYRKNGVPMNDERRRILESFRNGPTLLTTALRRFPRKMWVYKHASTGPSIHDSVCRIADDEVIEYLHCRSLVATPDSAMTGIDSVSESGRLGYFYQDISEALGIIRALRRFTYRFLENLPEDLWTRASDKHISLDQWLAIRESSYPEQIRRMERIYYEWLESTSSARTVTVACKTVSLESFVFRTGVAQENQ